MSKFAPPAKDVDDLYFNQEIEPLLNTPQMAKIQLEKLKPTLQFFYDHVPFDRERMDDAVFKPQDIESFDDLARALPICGQADYREVLSVLITTC